MTNDSAPKNPPKKTGETREDRLKNALKANMAKRKAQAQARKNSPEQEKGQD